MLSRFARAGGHVAAALIGIVSDANVSRSVLSACPLQLDTLQPRQPAPPTLGELAQPPNQGIAAGHDILRRAELVIVMGLPRIPWSKVDRRNAHSAKACDIGPTELGARRPTHGAEKFCGSRLVKARSGTSSHIGDSNGVAVKNSAYVRLGLRR